MLAQARAIIMVVSGQDANIAPGSIELRPSRGQYGDTPEAIAPLKGLASATNPPNCRQKPSADAEIARDIFLVEDTGNSIENNVIFRDFAQAAPSAVPVAAGISAGMLSGA